jgi:hypothetical protein
MQYTQRLVLMPQLTLTRYTRILAGCYDTLDYLHPRQGVEKISGSTLAGQLGSHALAVVFARERARIRSRCDPLHVVQLRSPCSARLVLHTSCCTSPLRVCVAPTRTTPGHVRSQRYAPAPRVVCTLCYTNLTRSARVWWVLRTPPTCSLRSRPAPSVCVVVACLCTLCVRRRRPSSFPPLCATVRREGGVATPAPHL